MSGYDGDLCTNPFVALFGSIEQACLYRSTFRNKSDSAGHTNVETGSSVDHSDVYAISHFIEDVFRITIDKDGAFSRQANYVFLEDLYHSLDGQTFLDLKCLEQAVFERIMLAEPWRHLVVTTDRMDCNAESHPVRYLADCFLRLQRSVKEAQLSCHVYSCCQSVIALNSRLCFQQPLLLMVSQTPCDVFIELMTTGDFDTVAEYFETVAMEIDTNKDEGSLADAFRAALDNIRTRLTTASLSQSYLLPVADVILFFTRKYCLAEVLLDYCSPRDPSQGKHYEETVIGKLLSVSCLASLSPDVTAEFFARPARLSPSEVDVTENMIYQLLGVLQEKIYQMIYALLKSGGTVRDKTLDWIGGCLHANAGRAKMWSHQMLPQMYSAAYSSDGFFLNLCVVLLRLSSPLTAARSQLSTRLQPTYCLATVGDRTVSRQHKVHMIDVKETCIIPMPADSAPAELEPTYSFTTECFYMTHYCLKLGFRTLHERLVKLNQELHRIQEVYRDVVQQGNSDTSERLKEDMERVMTVYLSLKAALTQPTLLDLCFAFHVATASYLAAIATNSKHDDIASSAVKTAPAILQYMPEMLAENIQDFMLFIRRFKDHLFEQQCEDDLNALLSFILVYMGSPNYMRNPHLRAGMAEALHTLLPPKSTSNTSSFLASHFQRERLFQTHPMVEQLAVALVNVFVSIEMTGQGVQFEHKFKYRQPMYVALEYLWNIDMHRKVLKLMSEFAEQHIDDTEAPLFLRFINLLINDAIYLLDEALSYMSQIKQKQDTRGDGSWPSLAAGQRSEAEAGYQHMSMLARFHNIMGNETIHALEMITSEIRSIFTNNIMVDRIAAMLNYFLLHLVGPKKRDLKVKNFEEFQFQPRELVANICRIYLHLGQNEAFARAVSRDGRSYSHSLFEQAEVVLCKIHEQAELISQFHELGLKIKILCTQQNEEDEALVNVPDEFLDPIMGDLMHDPVILPSSGKIVDRSTIARHILSDQFDPFNRQPLTMDMVQPAIDLKKQIDEWLMEKNIKK